MIPKPLLSIQDINTKINILNNEISYLKKKSEITPLIALYNHISGHNKEGKFIICHIDIHTKENTFSYTKEDIKIINDSIYESQDNEWKEICSVKDVNKITLDEFTYSFSN